jgi:hypothetical protein
MNEKDMAQLGAWLITQVELFPGFPVTLRYDGHQLWGGVLGLEVGERDFMIAEANMDDQIDADLAESIALEVANQKRRGNAVVSDDPGGTRTLNQLIKSQQFSGPRAKKQAVVRK